jgi:uncharacterized lipoprotein YmbA
MTRTTMTMVLATATLVGGCGIFGGPPPPTRYYVLTAVGTAATTPAASPGPVVGVGPVTIPPYLDRPQMMVRRGVNELEVTELHCWGEPLRDNIARVLTDNLSLLVPTERVSLFPWQSNVGLDYQVTVDVTAFEIGADGGTTLAARWTLRYGGDQLAIVAQRSRHTEPAPPADYQAAVSAGARALAALSEEIAAAIRADLTARAGTR